MSRLTQNAVDLLLAALLFALAINIAERAGHRVADRHVPDSEKGAHPLAHKIVLH